MTNQFQNPKSKWVYFLAFELWIWFGIWALTFNICFVIYDLIIIGGGPAGITAGIYAARKKINTLLLTKDFFGQIGSTGCVDNWPGEMGVGGLALMQKLEQHLRQFPIEIQAGEKAISVAKEKGGFSVRSESGKEFSSRALIVATGKTARKLGIEGEKDFLGKGLSYCAICDAPFFRDKRVAVVGGGNAGFETALDLAKYVSRVVILERSAKFLADELLQEQIKATAKIEVLLNTELQKVEGNGKVQSITYSDLTTQKTFQQPMDGVFVQIGSLPAVDFLGKLVKLNKNGEIKIDFESCATSQRGVFAAGDVTDVSWKQMIIAAGEGAKAALGAYEYLQKKWGEETKTPPFGGFLQNLA